MKNPILLQPQVKANRARADSTNLKIKREANNTVSKMFDIDDIEYILTFEFLEAVGNWKEKTVKTEIKII